MILTFSCSEEKAKSTKDYAIVQKIDTLKYAYNGFNNGLKLDLLSDGSFINENYVFSCFGGGERKKVFGTYTMDSTQLTLFPEKVQFIEYFDEMESKPKLTKVPYGTDSLKIKTNFKILTWNKTKYLFSDSFDYGWEPDLENDFIRFADYLNSGLEPNDHGMYLVSENKEIEVIENEFDLNQIPNDWRCYFLENPISAKTISIKKTNHPFIEESTTWKVELNKGEDDGIMVGLSFEAEDGNFLMEITKVSKNRSYGYFYYDELDDKNLPIGMELRTKWEKKTLANNTYSK